MTLQFREMLSFRLRVSHCDTRAQTVSVSATDQGDLAKILNIGDLRLEVAVTQGAWRAACFAYHAGERGNLNLRELHDPEDFAMKLLCDLAVLAVAACVVIYTFLQGLQ